MTMPDLLEKSNLPESLQESVTALWQQFLERLKAGGGKLPVDERLRQSLPLVWGSSAFVATQCVRRPRILPDLVESGDLFSQERRGVYLTELQTLLQAAEDEKSLHRILRRFRNREMVRIAWRDIAGWGPLEDVLCDLSLLAEACIQAALMWLFEKACLRYGTPLGPDGSPQLPVIIGMGKLGAWELNFSSDIDLIFAFEHDGVLEDKRGTSYQEFYLRLCRALVKALNAPTEDGFVFRVDTRLRPFGESGPLVMSFEAMEVYYQSQARDWERYAMIKARPVAGDPAAGERWMTMIKPFVYRRYLDYRALGALRELKHKIMQELKRRDRLEDIKLGPGGIREIEFIAQVFQLIRGGQEPPLQERRVWVVLARLAMLGQLPQADANQLIDAYRFLRLVENRLQEYADQQTQQLPGDEAGRMRLAYSLGFDEVAEFEQKLQAVRMQVQDMFEQVFAEPETGQAKETPAKLVWRLAGDDDFLKIQLMQLGFKDPDHALTQLKTFRQSRLFQSLPPLAEQELERLMPAVIEIAGKYEVPEVLLSRLLSVIEAIAGRTAYLTLLAENPDALAQLAKLAAASPWIARLLARQPILLDELLDPRTLYEPLTRQALEDELERRLASLDENDEEALLNALRHFKQAQVLRVAAADIMGVIPARVVSDYLTAIAEVVLDQAARLAWRHLAKQYGPPPEGGVQHVKDFAMIGYGKLGGIELGYASDLDLVFLFRGDPNAETAGPKPLPLPQFYIRLGQRVIHILTIPMLSGILYEVDMRLRPSGNAGLLVSSMEAFARYQRESAWTWEHQALVRARWVAGDKALAPVFAQIRMDVLCLDRDPEHLRREVVKMRHKMRDHLDKSSSTCFDLKQGAGGMVDIEFIVQFGCLLHAKLDREAFQYTDNLRLLDALAKVKWLSEKEASFLQETYLLYRERGHCLALQEGENLVPAEEFQQQRAGVKELWQRLLGEL